MDALVAAPILVTMTLVVSAVTKLGEREGIEDAMTSLRLPLRPAHHAIAAALPGLELLLALALWVPVAGIGVVAAGATTVLMLAYLVIIARALTFEEEVSCSCFGSLASPTVSRATLWRNMLLVVLSAAALVSAATGRTALALTQSPLALLGAALALLIAVVLTVLVLGGTRDAGARGSDDGAGRGDGTAFDDAALGGTAADDAAAVDSGIDGTAGRDQEELLDYERSPIPGGVLQRPDGSLVTLRQLAGRRAVLLIFVSEGCGPCERVLDAAPAWITDLAPFMDVRIALSRPLDQLREATLQRVGDHALHDLQFTARTALGARVAPSAVLLGADGLLAGGPVAGGSGVTAFVAEIQEQLAGAMEDGELRPEEHP
jgi:hypothetical protein